MRDGRPADVVAFILRPKGGRCAAAAACAGRRPRGAGTRCGCRRSGPRLTYRTEHEVAARRPSALTLILALAVGVMVWTVLVTPGRAARLQGPAGMRKRRA